MCANLDDTEFANAVNRKPPENKQEPKQTVEESYVLDADFLDRPITVQGIVFPTYRKYMESCEEYPDDDVYDPDYEYEEDDDDNNEETFMTDMEWRESIIKEYQNWKKNWRDDSPWNKLDKKDDITTAAYVINQEIDSADKGINAVKQNLMT